MPPLFAALPPSFEALKGNQKGNRFATISLQRRATQLCPKQGREYPPNRTTLWFPSRDQFIPQNPDGFQSNQQAKEPTFLVTKPVTKTDRGSPKRGCIQLCPKPGRVSPNRETYQVSLWLPFRNLKKAALKKRLVPFNPSPDFFHIPQRDPVDDPREPYSPLKIYTCP